MAHNPGSNPIFVAAFISVLGIGVAIGLVTANVTDPADAEPKKSPNALNGYVVIIDDSGPPSATAVQSARAVCPEGKGPIAGGYGTSGTVDDLLVLDNHPAGDFSVQEPGGTPVLTPDSWLVRIERTAGGGVWSMSAWAACVDIVSG